MKPKAILRVAIVALGMAVVAAPAEVILQFFNNSWNEISEKLPELAEVGYGSLWLPPPQKGSGAYSVGYDLWDPFDLGGLDQRGTVKTRYGTEEELLRLIETAHRFGIRVYFDNIMNHRAFDVPGYNEYTPIDTYPGMVPEDFHLRVTEEGFYRKWDNTVNWGSTWEVQYRNLSDLIDIAHETPNGNFGTTEGSTHLKPSFLRQPDDPGYYDYHPTLGYVGFGTTNITTNTLAQNESYYSEDVGGYLMRSIRWLVDRTKVDGLRLDAVKHVPSYFFGEQWDAAKDSSDSGYCGQAQRQFNLTRGFSDWDNHRDTVFDTEKSYGRNDLMIFGEHMGEPPGYDEYFAAGMRLVDAKIHQTLNDNLGNPWGTLVGLDSAGYVAGKQFGSSLGVPYAKSHDDNVAYRPELHYALNLTRAGLPDIYTDGNRHAETLGQSGGAFPRHANTAYLGQWGDSRIPNLVYIHNHFARADQASKWADTDVVVYERRDKRDNSLMSDVDGTTLLFMMNDDYSAGQERTGYTTTFPVGAKLWQYSTAGGNFYYTVPADQKMYVTIPPGGYFAFSWRSPEESALWSGSGGDPVTIYEGNGRQAGWVSYVRRDGPDGDAAFNPYGVADSDLTDFAYTYYVPRVTSTTNLRFVVRADGSAYNVLMRLDGGVPLNATNHSGGDPRDYPPGNEGSTDVYLGYEQAGFVQRIHPEKFAARDTVSNNVIGSAGAETYAAVVGTAGFTVNTGATGRDSDSETAQWIYHNPEMQDAPPGDSGAAMLQFDPPPGSAAGSNIRVRVKSGYQNEINKMFFYYTTDGATWPEGAGGEGRENTYAREMNWYYTTNTMDWWTCELPAFTNGTILRYKIGGYRRQDGGAYAPWDCPFPNSDADIARKTQMMGQWELTNVHPQSVVYRPHNDFGLTSTGLVDGFHLLSGRAFLQRDGSGVGNGKRAAIYNTFQQTFYLDTETPQGEIKYPSAGETLYQQEYGVVVRCDATVKEVWYNITDASAANDDAQTTNSYGNGTNLLGQTAWVRAYEVTPTLAIDSEYPNEWRFTYINIPTNGPSVMRVRLLELSSSTNLDYNPVDGHTTELSITNTASAPATQFFYDWPAADGTVVEAGWTLRVKFTKSLGDGVDDNTFSNRFLVTINGSAQGRSAYRVTRDIDGTYGQIEYDLPDIYNGDTNYLHHVVFTHVTAGGVTLQANRYIRTRPVNAGPLVQIIDPPEYDPDGQPYQIVLPDVASPAATQRQYMIRVETDLDAKDAWIAFTNSTGYTFRSPSVTNQLTGTVSVVAGTNLVTGSGTLFDSQVGAGNVLRISSNVVTVALVSASNSLVLTANYPGPTASGLPAYRIDPNPTTEGSKQYWYFLWTNMSQGSFRFLANVDTNNNNSTVEASATRNTTVLFREMANSDTNDLDDDDDGLYDSREVTPTNLPSSNPESWYNGDVHIWQIYGRTDALRPDTDGDGLPDGLELGWRTADASATDTNLDTNGDGYRNFIGDLDPPFYNTVPDNSGVPGYNFNDSRTKLIAGSMTDPNNPDTDYDGVRDSVEDKNRNGWVDGDGYPLYPTQDKSTRTNWPDKAWDSGWLETDPNDSDTDNDGASDGYGEDTNFNGRIEGDANTNRVWEAGELWSETDPLKYDTDGDGLRDGWETQYGFDALDSGILGQTNLRTGLVITNSLNGAGGNPDGDTYVVGLVTNAYSNIVEYVNGTNPRFYDSEEPPPEGTMTVGRGQELGVINGVTNYEEFTDWSWDDLIVLDEYEGDGGNNQQGDVFPRWDGFDTSRDIVAFYAHDGGDTGAGGDGKFYFRIDLLDLQAYAEEGYLDLYVVIDTGNPAEGEMGLPDDVDAMTSNRWEAVVAVYQSSAGRVYVDLDPDHNSTTVDDGYNLAAFGVEVRDQNHAYGFQGAYFNSELDSVEFSISRQALRDAGWNGISAATLNYQVFAVKDGCCNSCGTDGAPGAGDIGGRNDICDSIYDDGIAEDYWESQAGISSVLSYWFSGGTQAGRAKAAVMVHGGQAILPGSDVQDLINDGAGAGYQRLLAVHEIFNQPVNLHIPATLASAIQWARVDTNLSATWRDGPTFNETIRRLAATGVVYLAASTYADHMLPYFTYEFNEDNETLARETLEDLYGVTFSTNSVFWTPERLLDADALDKIRAMGYRSTVFDQDTHLLEWFGRTDSMGENGYSINQVRNVLCFPINNLPTRYRFENTDNGLSTSLRKLFSRRARGDQHRITTIFSAWEDFGDYDDAGAYDLNVRWIANHPWVKLVAYEQVLKGEVDLNGDGGGDTWWSLDRGLTNVTKQSHDWINHASQGNYDDWFVGSSLEEGLLDKVFEIRPGTNVNQRYGMMYFAGLVTSAWEKVASIADTNIAKMARATLHASVFETAFHDEDNNDLSRWSTGEYIYPDATSNSIAGFAAYAQSQTRNAAIYDRVDTWAGLASGYTTPQTAAEDVDLDGEAEYLLYNDRLLALFERIGGRLVGVWTRDVVDNSVLQAAGNFVSYPGTDDETEGEYNVETNGVVVAYRTSCLKDWWASANGNQYINNLYTAVNWTNGWRLTSADGAVQKTVTLQAGSWDLVVNYAMSGSMSGQPLYIRNGLSPNLYDLLKYGQDTLGDEQDAGGTVTLANTSYVSTVRATVRYADGTNTAGYNPGAVDDNPGEGVTFYTVNRRNQAQTHQVELVGTNSFRFTLGFKAEASDWNANGMPNTWEDGYGLDTNVLGGADQDADLDTVLNWEEYRANTSPTDDSDFLQAYAPQTTATGIVVRFATKSNRRYYVDYDNAPLASAQWRRATTNFLAGTGGTVQWVDWGVATDPDPAQVSNRFYRVEVVLPE